MSQGARRQGWMIRHGAAPLLLVMALVGVAPAAAIVPVPAAATDGAPATGMAAATPGFGATDAIVPAVTALPKSSHRPRLRDTMVNTILEPGFRIVILLGIGAIFVAAFVRRRRRRRIGWGVLPARPPLLGGHDRPA